MFLVHPTKKNLPAKSSQPLHLLRMSDILTAWHHRRSDSGRFTKQSNTRLNDGETNFNLQASPVMSCLTTIVLQSLNRTCSSNLTFLATVLNQRVNTHNYHECCVFVGRHPAWLRRVVTIVLDVTTKNKTRLQMVQNTLARVVTGLHRRHHITPSLKRLHWLPIKFRIIF